MDDCEEEVEEEKAEEMGVEEEKVEEEEVEEENVMEKKLKGEKKKVEGSGGRRPIRAEGEFRGGRKGVRRAIGYRRLKRRDKRRRETQFGRDSRGKSH